MTEPSTGMKILRTAETLLVIFALIGTVASTFWFMEYRHAKRTTLLKTELGIKAEILDRGIKRDSDIRVYYEDLAADRELEKAEQARLKYIERKLERGYGDQDSLQAQLSELEAEVE
jgi:hypothetical protein